MTDTTPPKKWQSRKFWLSVGCILITTFLLWNGKLDQNVYQNLLYLLVGGYLVANTSQSVLLAKEGEK